MILRDLLTLFSSWTFCLMQQDGMGLSVNVCPIMMTLAAEGALPNEICNLFVFATNDMYSRAAMNWVHVCTYGLRSAQCSKPTFTGSAWRRRRLLCHVDGAEDQCGRGISLNVHSAAESCRLVKSCTIRKRNLHEWSTFFDAYQLCMCYRSEQTWEGKYFFGLARCVTLLDSISLRSSSHVASF